jgi:hypothetical protein
MVSFMGWRFDSTVHKNESYFVYYFIQLLYKKILILFPCLLLNIVLQNIGSSHEPVLLTWIYIAHINLYRSHEPALTFTWTCIANMNLYSAPINLYSSHVPLSFTRTCIDIHMNLYR